MMGRADAEAFARQWAEMWNRADLNALMAHYDQNVTFVSPRAEPFTGTAIVRGREALRAYWSAAMRRTSARRFRIKRTIWDDERMELAIVYVSDIDGARLRACEIMRFDETGRVVSGEALYGARHEAG
jgi:ketosteroid isomerase-like protein